MIGFDHVILIL